MSAKIASKMVKAMAMIDAVEKKGRNQAQGYNYVRATDVANEVRTVLHELGIAFSYSITSIQHWEKLKFDKESGQMVVGMYMCEVAVTGTFTDAESGEQATCDAVGWGADPLDKAAFKAMTGALKYLLRMAFLIPDELDPENEQKEVEVRKEVQRQKAAPAKDVAPELDWSYNKSSGVLICRVVSVEKKAKADGKEYVVLTVNNELDKGKRPLLYYWHATHRPDLLAAKGKVVKLMVIAKEKGFTVDQVMEIDGVVLKRPEESEETQARLLASVLSFEEEELREFYSTVCAGSWTRVLEALKQRKAEVDAGVEAGER